MNAIISKDGKYRYQLGRTWPERVTTEGVSSIIMWLMLNPSTANESIDDATVRRCTYFSQGWGFSTMLVGNLYAFRAVKPSLLWSWEKNNGNIVGPQNDFYLANMADLSQKIVLAWGEQAPAERVNEVMTLLRPWLGKCFTLGYTNTKGGQPRHPLYAPKDAQLVPYSIVGIKNASRRA